jgi:hypothetical protein
MFLSAVLLQIAAIATVVGAPGTWRAVVVGGGPSAAMNQVGIERNVRYFERRLPVSIDRRVLFADGRRDTATVQFLAGEELRYRRPDLARIDGPTTATGFLTLWGNFVAPRASDPLMLYFAGHGSPNRGSGLENNWFDLWGGGVIDVQRLAAKIAELPPSTPVVVVMAQCYSGSFANLLFEGGRPDAPVLERDLVGFFAATNDRPASGCTPEVNEADYQDFSSYFFAALSGKSRLDVPVKGADFDGNGVVGMNEAYAYAIIHQQSEDVPVTTSDAFLRRFVSRHDAETMATSYTSILTWASPAQRAALQALSTRLGLRGDDRLQRTYDAYFGAPSREGPVAAHQLRFVRLAKSVVLAHHLLDGTDAALKQRYERLRAAESRTPFAAMPAPPPAEEEPKHKHYAPERIEPTL